METKYKMMFAAQIRAIEPDEQTQHEAKASLSQLKSLLPAGIDPEKEPALLFVAGNLAVAGLVNLNDDGMDIETGLSVYKRFEKGFIDIEHDRKAIRGFIVHAGLTEFGTDRVITEDEARAAGKPFNIAVVMAFWKAVDKDLCAYILEASSPTHIDSKTLSLSWEIGFEGYRVIGLPLGDPVISNASLVVRPDDSGFDRYSAALRAYKGPGLSPDDANLRLFRIADQGVEPLGGGVVTMPAAFVKGVTAITEVPAPVVATIEPVVDPEEEKSRLAANQLAEAMEEGRRSIRMLLSSLEEKMTASIIQAETRVSPITPKTITQSTMKHDKKSLLAAADKATTVDELKQVFANTIDFTDTLTKLSEEREAARVEAESQATKLQATKDASESAAAQLTKDLELVRTELNQIKSAQASAAAEQKFQERMSAISEVFDLDDDSRAFFGEEVKSCATDEAFAAKFEKFKKLMPEKTKDSKKKKADSDKEKADAAKAAVANLQAEFAKKGVTAKINDVTLAVEEIIASAVSNPISDAIPNAIVPSEDLRKTAAEALRDSMTIGGKKLSEIKAAK